MTSIPPHYVHIYQRPAQGETFIDRKQAFKYQHQKLAVGGDDTLSCELAMKPTEAQIALENWIGCRVAAYVDNPAAPIWEGIINRVYYDDGTLMVTRSLDEMFNRVEMLYDPIVTGQTLVAAADEADSQAIYGVKHGTCEGFVRSSSAANNNNLLQAVRDLIIAQVAWPLTSVTESSGTPLFRLEAVGFYHTLEWDTYYKAAGAVLRNPTSLITTVLAAINNGNTFIDNTDVSRIETNAAFTIPDTEYFGKTVWQILQSVQGGGDGSAYWVMGVHRTDPITGTRRFFYKPGNTDVEYTCRSADGLRPRNQWGGLVRLWAMEPDRVMRVNDLLIGWGGRGLDPRETYIEALRYDADSQKVTWSGADDLHMQGALQLNRYYKMHGSILSGVQRTAWN